uniref:hypothetical protein n=1 Tax=Methanosarcina acetivorans TaxID=2214 RepID=UPI001866C3A7|nr:hypothetical protein [Methanosarcina acetivorans]
MQTLRSWSWGKVLVLACSCKEEFLPGKVCPGRKSWFLPATARKNFSLGKVALDNKKHKK